jgi:chromosome segregation ATPase
MTDKLKQLQSELEAMEAKKDLIQKNVSSETKELKTLEKQIKLQRELIESLKIEG